MCSTEEASKVLHLLKTRPVSHCSQLEQSKPSDLKYVDTSKSSVVTMEVLVPSLSLQSTSALPSASNW